MFCPNKSGFHDIDDKMLNVTIKTHNPYYVKYLEVTKNVDI